MNTSNIIKGDNLMVFLNDKAIAFATSHTITLSSNLSEITCKDGDGWSTGLAGSKSWECTSENLCSMAKSTDINNAYNLIPIFVSSTPVNLMFGFKDREENSYLKPDTDSSNMTGQAIITNLSINANSGDNATMSVTFKGITPITLSNFNQ